MQTITRADKAYSRKWLAAYRKGKPTAEITREWLAKMAGPARPPGWTCMAATAFYEPYMASASAALSSSWLTNPADYRPRLMTEICEEIV